jgi:DNA-binding NarL/FixJ family response regulator
MDGGSLPPLPLAPEHWRGIVKSMGLSAQQARIVELVLRGARQKEIADLMRIAEPTVKTYLQRIFVRTKTTNRMQLAMRVLAHSHARKTGDGRHPKR